MATETQELSLETLRERLSQSEARLSAALVHLHATGSAAAGRSVRALRVQIAQLSSVIARRDGRTRPVAGQVASRRDTSGPANDRPFSMWA